MTEILNLPEHVVFDLDGTLIDIRRKYYAAYKECARGTPIPQSTYWRLKRAKKLPPSDAHFINTIESEKYLSLDTLFPFTESCLKRLVKQRYILHLVSARRNATAGRKEVTRLGIAKFFTTIDIGHNGHDVVATKTAFINKQLLKGTDLALIGDTEDDINAARELGGVSVAVTSGIRNKTYLARFSPDVIVPSINGLLDFAKKHR